MNTNNSIAVPVWLFTREPGTEPPALLSPDARVLLIHDLYRGKATERWSDLVWSISPYRFERARTEILEQKQIVTVRYQVFAVPTAVFRTPLWQHRSSQDRLVFLSAAYWWHQECDRNAPYRYGYQLAPYGLSYGQWCESRERLFNCGALLRVVTSEGKVRQKPTVRFNAACWPEQEENDE